MNITNADVPIDYTGAINILENLGKTDYPCVILGEISSIETQLNKSSDCLFDYNITIEYLNNNIYYLNTFGVNKGHTNTNCGNEAGILNKINGENYIPQIGDYIIAKVNPENHYIIGLYPTKGKSVDNMLNDMKSLDMPYCKMSQESTQGTNILKDNKQIQGLGNTYLIIGISILIGLILGLILALIFKKRKKQG